MANTSSHATTTALLLLICTSTIVSNQVAGLTCPHILTSISGCIGYVRGLVGVPPPGCCVGIRNLIAEYPSTPDRQQACRCLQAIIKSLPGVNTGRVAALSDKCGVNVGYNLTLSLDCSK
ncbi:Non-specific lipid-transfer protein 1 [Platanthera guangdongensis]|uniref:Non-specific lipid-transfer protein n=1 Tax=Platanthera guangdongensis TaxID=2320717 RepID=A0ABR2MJY3_9ASPA